MTCKTDLVDHQRTKLQILSYDKKTWEDVNDITELKTTKTTRDKDDVTTLADDDTSYVPAGPRSHSDITGTFLKRTDSAMQKRLDLSAYHSICERWRIIVPDKNNTTNEFCGYLLEYGDETDAKKKTRVSFNITISGEVVKYDINGYLTNGAKTEGPALNFPLEPLIPVFDPLKAATPVTPTPVTPTPAPLAVDNLTVAPATILQGQTATVTVTFNQAVSGLTEASFVADNATVSNVQSTDGITWTATLTPLDGVDNATGTVKLVAGSYTANDGQAGIAKVSDSYVVDTAP